MRFPGSLQGNSILYGETGLGGFVSTYWEPSSVSAGIQGVLLAVALPGPGYMCAFSMVGVSGTEAPLSHIEDNHLFTQKLRPGGVRLVGPPRAVKHRRSALGLARVFTTTDHDFPFPPAGGSDVRHGCPGRTGGNREGGSREMSATGTGTGQNQNEPPLA